MEESEVSPGLLPDPYLCTELTEATSGWGDGSRAGLTEQEVVEVSVGLLSLTVAGVQGHGQPQRLQGRQVSPPGWVIELDLD